MGEGMRGLMDPSYFWRRSLTSAVMGARLAKAVYPRKREEIFLSALLADIGLIILGRVFAQEYRPILECYGPRGTAITEERERSAVGASHGEVSAVVMAD